jgi:two-component system chemotaxis response regulator CheB
MKKINVAIIDDSALVRQVLTGIIKSDSELELALVAQDPIFALDKMKAIWPDVIILDIEMPRMDGLSFLKRIMNEHPTPIIICSTLTGNNSESALEAMSLGAVEILTKPQVGLKNFLEDSKMVFLDAIKSASLSNMKLISKRNNFSFHLKISEKPPRDFSNIRATEKIIAIGTSTGGTIALEEILSGLEPTCPGIVIVQHMPEKFTAAFAGRLNSICKIEVREAKNGDRVLPGLALIAQGNRHMSLKRSGAQYFVEVQDGPLVSRHRPSVNVLFRSVARHAGKNSVGIIMTGMGDDGASGMKEMKESGAETFAQDEESCVVFGMPKEAIKLGCVDKIVPLSDLANIIMKYRI